MTPVLHLPCWSFAFTCCVPPFRLSGVQRTPRHDAFVQMLQQEQDEVEDFSSSGSSGCEGFHSQFVQTHQQPRKMRRRAKRMLNGSGNNRDKKGMVLSSSFSSSSSSSSSSSCWFWAHTVDELKCNFIDTVVREDDLIIVEETGFQQGEEEAEGEEEGESRTTPPVEYNPCQMTEDGGFVVDPSAISDSPIRSYQQIGSLVGKSSIDYSNQFSSRGRGQRQMSSSSTRGSCRARHSRGRSHSELRQSLPLLLYDCTFVLSFIQHCLLLSSSSSSSTFTDSGHQKRFFAGRRGKGKGKSGPTRGKKGRRWLIGDRYVSQNPRLYNYGTD